MANTTKPFDAVLLISFGGPEGMDDIRPFLRNVLRGRRIPDARIDAVAKHYEMFGGVSPLRAITEKQASALAARLKSESVDLPVFIGMRNWHPFLDSTLKDMARLGIKRVFGIILAAHHSYSSCGQYRRNIAEAQDALSVGGSADIELVYAPNWHTHPGFIAANVQQIQVALKTLPQELGRDAALIFTAHSIPTSMANDCRYETELKESARGIAERLGFEDWHLVYQSRSGRPGDPWLEPDICDFLTDRAKAGLRAALLCPLGFVADHIEVLYDLDYEAKNISKNLGLAMARAAAVNDHPEFVGMLADLTLQAYANGRRSRVLPIVSQATTTGVEGPPPER